jgi:hypothetical protein
MRVRAHIPAAFIGLALAATGCSDAITAPGAAAPEAASFARQNPNTGQATFGNLIAALNNVAVNINNLEALNDLTVADVRVVNVEDVLNGNNVQALNNALNNNDVDVNVLRDFLNNSVNDNVVIVNDVLDIGNVLVQDVIALQVNVLSGQVTVFQFQQ